MVGLNAWAECLPILFMPYGVAMTTATSAQVGRLRMARTRMAAVAQEIDAARARKLMRVKPDGPAQATLRHRSTLESRPMYQHILVAVDGSGTSNQALSEAVAVARLSGGRLRLVHVLIEPLEVIGIDGAMCNGVDIFKLVREGGELVLAKAKEQVVAQGIPVDTELLDSFDGRVCDLVVRAAQAWPAELIVLGTHGRRGVGRMLLGSDAEQILRIAPVPVLLVRGAPD
jgi:nucleotide-binding universal stress UspA family protein